MRTFALSLNETGIDTNMFFLWRCYNILNDKMLRISNLEYLYRPKKHFTFYNVVSTIGILFKNGICQRGTGYVQMICLLLEIFVFEN